MNKVSSAKALFRGIDMNLRKLITASPIEREMIVEGLLQINEVLCDEVVDLITTKIKKNDQVQ